MTSNETIIERIRKLNAKANDKSVTEAEAALYAQKVAELLQQHNLSESSLDVKEDDQDVTEDRFENSWTNNPWTHEIANYVAQLYFCDFYYIRHGQRCKIVFVGKPHNIEVAKSMTDYLIKTVTRLALAYAQSPIAKADFDWTPVRARNGFQRGAARRLAQRLNAMYQEQAKANKPERAASGNPANLPALYQDEAKLVQAYIDRLNLGVGRGRGSSTGGNHAANGRNAANNISLNSQVGGSSTRMIGGR